MFLNITNITINLIKIGIIYVLPMKLNEKC